MSNRFQKHRLSISAMPAQAKTIGLALGVLCAAILWASPQCAQGAPAISPATTPSDIHKQFQPAKDDDGDDYAESQELLYQWMNPRYSNDEKAEMKGIAAYFVVIAAGITGSRIIARSKRRWLQ